MSWVLWIPTPAFYRSKDDRIRGGHKAANRHKFSHSFRQSVRRLMVEIKEKISGKILLAVDADTLRRSDLKGANLVQARLKDAELAGANLREADLTYADLTAANLKEAELTGANLTWARPTGANLAKADLRVALCSSVHFEGTNLTSTMLGSTYFANCSDLHLATGLNDISHYNGSYLDRITLQNCIHGLPDVFLEGCGYTKHEIDYLRSLYVNSPIRYFSCFISHCKQDLEFARRLLADLRQSNVTCWHNEADMLGGRDWIPQLHEAIKLHDKLILVCSRRSIYSENEVHEIQRAIDVERETGVRKLFPIRLDDHILSPEMTEHADDMVRTSRWRENWVTHIRRKQIPDFSNWTQHGQYKAEFDKLLKALESSNLEAN